jgi:hypothetical protein
MLALTQAKCYNFFGRAFGQAMLALTQAKCYNFFGRAFGQAMLALTQRREIRSFFGDWVGDYKFI